MKKFLRYLTLILPTFALGCTDLPLAQEVSSNRVSMDVGFEIYDVSCKEIKSIYLPTRLQELDIPYEWTEKSEGLLATGPFTVETDSGNTYSKLRQNYFLRITCSDELTTSISGEVILEGLNATGQWVWINDPVTIEKQSMRFMEILDL